TTDAGAHTLSATLKTAGSQALTATDTGTVTITGVQAGITVDPTAASSLVVSGFPSPTTAGVSGAITVTAHDPYDNTATGYTGKVHFTSSDAQAALPSDYTFSAADGGVHNFTATLRTAGSQSLTLTDMVTSTITGTQTGITVNAAAASSLAVSGFPSPTTAGVAGTVTVTAQDPYGNTAVTYTGTVQFTSSDARAALPANYAFVSADAGAHVLCATLKPAGNQSLTVTVPCVSTVTATPAVITLPLPAALPIFVSGFPSPTTAGVAGTFTVTAQDPYGNTAITYAGTVQFMSSDAPAALPANY